VEKKERNYDIYCVKYESFFDNIEKFNEMMGIENCPELYPKKKETRRDEILLRIYYNLIKKMESMDFITVSPRSDVASAAAAPQKEEQKSVLPTSAAKKPMNLIFNTDPLGNAK
jgi:hypothetical protein